MYIQFDDKANLRISTSMKLFTVAACLVSAYSLVVDDCDILDLTYRFDEDTIYWPTAKPFNLETVFAGYTGNGFFYSANNLAAAEHGGTHLDAPYHFAENGIKQNEIPLSHLVGEGCVVDVTDKTAADRDYLITAGDLENAGLQGRCIVLLKTGWGSFWPNKTLYLGTDSKNVSLLHFPGLSPEGAVYLVNLGVKAIGIDTASIDYGQSTQFDSHQILGAANVPVIENVANLHRLPHRGSTVFVMPMKIKDGTGGPTRVIAMNLNETCVVD